VPTEVLFVRHGEIAAKRPGDLGLSDAGRAMAAEVGWAVAPRQPAVVVSSPLRRAVETAEAVAAAWGGAPTIDQRLRERMNWGDLPGQPFEQFVELWDRCGADRDLEPDVPGGRSARRCGQEAVAVIDELATRDRPVVVVAHGGVLAELLTCLAEDGRGATVDRSVDVPYCSITRLRWTVSAVELLELAGTAHLTEVRTVRSD
jgi:broad specificity phosphatase PhoE